jgi:hypothetical protein
VNIYSFVIWETQKSGHKQNQLYIMNKIIKLLSVFKRQVDNPRLSSSCLPHNISCPPSEIFLSFPILNCGDDIIKLTSLSNCN